MTLNVRKITLDNIYYNGMIYGAPGSGKTTLASTAQDHPRMSPVLVASAEAGNLSIAGRGDIYEIPIETMADLEALAWAIARKDDEVKHFRTVILDSGSELAAKSLQESIDRERQRRGTTASRSPDMVELTNYGESRLQMKRITRMFRDLPVHMIMTALVRNSYPRNARAGVDTEPVSASPSFSGQLAQDIVALLDHCHYLYSTDDASRHLLTREHGIYIAKTRGANFAEAIGVTVDNPTMPMLYEKLLESEGTPKKQLKAVNS